MTGGAAALYRTEGGRLPPAGCAPAVIAPPWHGRSPRPGRRCKPPRPEATARPRQHPDIGTAARMSAGTAPAAHRALEANGRPPAHLRSRACQTTGMIGTCDGVATVSAAALRWGPGSGVGGQKATWARVISPAWLFLPARALLLQADPGGARPPAEPGTRKRGLRLASATAGPTRSRQPPCQPPPPPRPCSAL